MKLQTLLFTTALGLSVSMTAIAADEPTALSSPEDKFSYSLGMELGKNMKQGFKQQNMTVEPAAFAQGLEDAIAGNTPALSPKQMEATLQAFQEKQDAAQQENAKKAVLANSKNLFSDAESPVSGNLQGTITVVEFFDYQCPHCRNMLPVIDKLTAENKQVRVVYKEFPILGEASVYAAQAALAAKKQGKYLEMHDALLSVKKRLTEEEILDIAKKVGLNLDQLKQDMADPSIMDAINNNYELAQKLGLQATPAFIIANLKTLNSKTPKVSFVPGATSYDNLAAQVAAVETKPAP